MFIVFEGPAGIGKTTQAQLLEKYLLDNKGQKIFYSSAFEGKRRDNVSQFIEIMNFSDVNDSVMFLFQCLHSLQHHEVKSALETDKIVIADRWRESFIVHHTYAKTFNNYPNLLESIDSFTFKDLEPDIYIHINIDPEVACKRYQEREKILGNSGLKLMDLEYFKYVSNLYLNIAKNKGWIIVDGNGEILDVFDRIVLEINKKI